MDLCKDFFSGYSFQFLNYDFSVPFFFILRSGCSGPWNEEVEKLPTRERENRNNFRRKAPIWWWKTPFVLSDMLGEVFFLSLQTYYCKHKMKKKCMSTTHLTMHQNFLWRWFKFGWWELASHHSMYTGLKSGQLIWIFEYCNFFCKSNKN